MAIVLKLLTLYSQWNFAKGRIKKKYTAKGERENGLHKQLSGEVFRAILACVASVSNRVIARKLRAEPKKRLKGEGEGTSSFVPLPLPRHSCFFCSFPSFLDEPREETLATQASAIPAQGDFISEGPRSSHHDKG